MGTVHLGNVHLIRPAEHGKYPQRFHLALALGGGQFLITLPGDDVRTVLHIEFHPPAITGNGHPVTFPWAIGDE